MVAFIFLLLDASRRPNETVEKPFSRSETPCRALNNLLLGAEYAWDRVFHPLGGYWSAPKTQIFPILCAIAYNLHCTSTYALLRKVNRFMRLCTQMFAKTGPTIASRRAGLSLRQITMQASIGEL